jgi:hypothetical protein
MAKNDVALKQGENQAPVAEETARLIPIDTTTDSLREDLARYKFSPDREIRLSAESGPTVFLPQPYKLQQFTAEEVTHYIQPRWFGRLIGRQPAPERETIERRVTYGETLDFLRPFLSGEKAITHSLLMSKSFSEAYLKVLSQLVPTAKGDLLISLKTRRFKKDDAQLETFGPLVAQAPRRDFATMLVLDNKGDDNPLNDEIQIVMGSTQHFLNGAWKRLGPEHNVFRLSDSFNIGRHTRGTAGDFRAPLIQSLQEVEHGDYTYWIDEDDVKMAFNMAILLASVQSDYWKDIYEEMQARTALFSLLTRPSGQSTIIEALATVLEPIIVPGNAHQSQYSLVQQNEADHLAVDAEAREKYFQFIRVVSPILGEITGWQDLIRKLNATDIFVRQRGDEAVLGLLIANAPLTLKDHPKYFGDAVRLGDAVNARVVEITAHMQAIIGIRREMAKIEGGVGALRVQVLETYGQLIEKETRAVDNFLRAAKNAIDVHTARLSGEQVGKAINIRLQAAAQQANADLPPADQLREGFKLDLERREFAQHLSATAANLLPPGKRTRGD